jgi:23S rRNA (guanosine2251-2'-O)-methyltransferase
MKPFRRDKNPHGRGSRPPHDRGPRPRHDRDPRGEETGSALEGEGPARASNAETRWIGGFDAVRTALERAPNDARALWIEHEIKHEAISAIVRLAKDLNVPVQYMARPELDRAVKGAKHQGVALKAVYDPAETFAEWLAGLDDARKKGLVVVALDQIQDPHNLGAIARSALQLGARCVVIPERRSAPVTQAVIQASAGAALKIPVHRVVNLAQTLARCKEAGFWTYGADASGKPAWDATLNTPCVLVVGSEGYGMRPLVRASCDELLSVPQVANGVGSLNASCAATALLYEIARQKAKTS